MDILLADVQGAELQMLEGARNSIAQGKIRFALISTHHHSISNDPVIHQRCLQFLEERHAHIVAAHSVSESYSGDGLIAASFCAADRDMLPVAISKNHASNSLFREVEFDLAETQDAIASLRRDMAEIQFALHRQSRELELMRVKATELKEIVQEKEKLISGVLHSTSWKVSKPVRLLGRLLRRLKSQQP